MNLAWWAYFVTFLAATCFLVYKYSTRKYNYWAKRNVKFVKPIPLFGSILPIFALKKTLGEWLKDLVKSTDAEDYFGIYVFDEPVLIIKSPKMVKAILQKDFAHFEDRAVVTGDDPVMNHVMFFRKNPEWRPSRAKVSPIFTSGKLKAMFPLVLHESLQMVEYISRNTNNVVDMEAKEISAKYSTNVISRCAFAVDAGSFQSEDALFRSLTREMFGFRFDTTLRQMSSWFAPNIVKFFKIQFFHPRIINACKNIFKDVFETRLQSKNLQGRDLIDMLIESNRKTDGKMFTFEAMVGHATQFLAAGFETVSSTLSFALYELAVNPDMQERLRKEIMENFTRDNDISYQAIHDMKYLDMIVCETLRKYPVLPFLDRMCKLDYKVEGSDFVIEKGIAVYLPMFHLHYHPKYFPNPDEFDPERFADKSWINNDGIFFVPFGDGPRVCLGERFGLITVKTAIAQTLLKFKLERTGNTPVPVIFEPKSVVLQSTIGLPIKFRPL